MKILLVTECLSDQNALSQIIEQCGRSTIQLTYLSSVDENTTTTLRSADLIFVDTSWMNTHASILQLGDDRALLPHVVLITQGDTIIPSWLKAFHRCIYAPFHAEEIMSIIWDRWEDVWHKEEDERKGVQQEIRQFKETPSLGDQRLVFSNQEEIIFISPLDLIRIEAKGNCSLIYALGYPTAFCVSTNLGEFTQRLEGVPFLFQPHRSHLVNLYHVKKLTRQRGGALLVRAHQGSTDALLPLSQQRREELMAKMAVLGEKLPLLRSA